MMIGFGFGHDFGDENTTIPHAMSPVVEFLVRVWSLRFEERFLIHHRTNIGCSSELALF
jgi:hypothetical protein